MRCGIAFVLISLTAFTQSAYAADDDSLVAAPAVVIEPASLAQVASALPPVQIVRRRPIVLPVLYVSLVALHGLDGYTTTSGLSRGAREANPMMSGAAQHPAALWAVKAASAAGSVWLAERMWKSNRVGAIVTMVVANGVVASVTARNVSVLNTLR